MSLLEDELEGRVPEVYGCTNCGLIYEPQVYHHSDVAQREDWPWAYCPACSVHGVKFLGLLPDTIETLKGFYLLDSEGEALGPFKSFDEAYDSIWGWFQETGYGCKEEKEGGQEDSKVIRLVCGDTACRENQSETEES